jgi:hypothetical protein
MLEEFWVGVHKISETLLRLFKFSRVWEALILVTKVFLKKQIKNNNMFCIHALQGYFHLIMWIENFKNILSYFFTIFVVVKIRLGSCWPLTSRVLCSFAGQCVGFVVNKVAVGQGFLRFTLVFFCQYHSTNSPSSFIHVSLALYSLNQLFPF